MMNQTGQRDEALTAWQTPYARTPYDLWTRTNVGEVFPRVLTPLTYSVVDLLGQRLFTFDPKRAGAIPPDLIKNGVLPAIFRVINGRMFYNTGLIHYLFTERFGMPSWFWMMGLGGPQDPAGQYFEQKPFRPMRMLGGLRYILGESRRQRQSIAAFHRDCARMEAQALALTREDIAALDLAGLAQRLDHIIDLAQPSQAQLLDGSAAAVSAFGMLAGLCGRWLGDPNLANDLVTGSGDMQTANATLALWDVAERAEKVPQARREIATPPAANLGERLSQVPGARAVAESYARFFRDFGHRCVDEFELSTPRWSEQPELPVAMLRTYFDAPETRNPKRAVIRQRRRRRAATKAARERLTRGWQGVVPYRWVTLRIVLKQARALLPLRENPKHLFLRYLSEIRRTILAIGTGLAGAGLIRNPEDVFFLTRTELRAAVAAAERGQSPAALQTLIVDRRGLLAVFEHWQPPEAIAAGEVEAIEREALKPLPAESNADDTPVGGTADRKGTGLLSGLAASSGVVTGRARVALTPEEGAELEPGEILVAPFTDPGWTPLFAVAGGIVMDLGGMLSHGAIVAREYGIPAVVNTRSATVEIQNGQLVTVDGRSGTVSWKDDDAAAD